MVAGKNPIFSAFYRPVWACNLHPSVIFYRVVILIFPYFTHTHCQLLQLLHCGGLLSLWLKYISIRGWNIFIVKYCVTPNNDQMNGSLAPVWWLPTKAVLEKWWFSSPGSDICQWNYQIRLIFLSPSSLPFHSPPVDKYHEQIWLLLILFL